MKEIKANITGVVLYMYVKEGDYVQAGQEPVILESMKMEIPVESEMSGTVVQIKVNVGDFVNEGDVLIVLSQP
ncbi:biotin/lipoyl-binding carrier protein [Metabacillus fastidiosus]|uniref:biotin/lipoyl-binding carrier protein n=1 Tax=Metabacillus fastidiosus TaxID=1458 RepID=UPI003D2CFF87